MKQVFKTFTIFTLVFITTILFTRCQIEEILVENDKNDFTFKTVKLEDVKKYSSKASIAFINTTSKSSTTKKFSQNPEVDSSNVIFLERNNGFKSFTYRLKDDLSQKYFHNIVIYNYPDGSIKSFTIKYLLNKSLLESNFNNDLKSSIIAYEILSAGSKNKSARSAGYTCVSIGYWTPVEKCQGELVTPSNNPTCFNADGTRATKEVFITIDEDCTFSPSGGSAGEGDEIYVGGIPADFGLSGDGYDDLANISGIFIPNPYEYGEEDPNNPDFMFSNQVSQFLILIPSWNNLMYRANTFGGIRTYWMQPFFVDYFKNNGGLTTENKAVVRSVVERFTQIIFSPNESKIYQNTLNGNLIHYKLFKTLLQYPTLEAGMVLDLYAYQAQNLWSQESNDFCQELITQIINNPGLILDANLSSRSPFNIDVTKVTPSTTDSNEINHALKVKFRCVYDKLIQSPKFKELFEDMFGENMRPNVTFEIANLDGDQYGGTVGDTKIPADNPMNNTITIDTDLLQNGNNMQIAKTIIHECIHAFLNVKLCEPSLGMSIPYVNNMEVYNCINQYYKSFPANTQEQHNFN